MHTEIVRKQVCSCVAMMVCGKDVCGNMWLCVRHCGALCGNDGVAMCVAVMVYKCIAVMVMLGVAEHL